MINMTDELKLNRETIFILFTLKKAGFEAYLVGGALRDLMLGKNPFEFDYDFATNATPDQILVLFPESFYENQFGTVSIPASKLWRQLKVSPSYLEAVSTLTRSHSQNPGSKIIDLALAQKVHSSLVNQLNTFSDQEQSGTPKLPNFEITTYRSDEVYTTGSRKPQSLKWGKTIEEDLKRRDFTINAMALTLSLEKLSDLSRQFAQDDRLLVKTSAPEVELISYPGASDDLSYKLIRSVGNPTERFAEDALRMLRAVRLAVQLEVTIDQDTLNGIAQSVKLIKEISFERIRDEVLKMLISKHPKKAIELLDETGLLGYILPELLKAKGVHQGGHHTTDVWTHSLDALAACPSQDPIVRLATLLHDIAKPVTFKLLNGQPSFYNHEVIGARVARDIGRRLKLPKHQIDRLFILTRHHMFHYQEHNTDSAVRRLMRKVGLGNVDDILDLREGDRLGSGARKTSWRLEEMKQRMIEQLNQPLTTHDLAINGNDLMTELKLKPGPILGQILSDLLEKVLEKPEANTKSSLLKLAKEKIIFLAEAPNHKLNSK